MMECESISLSLAPSSSSSPPSSSSFSASELLSACLPQRNKEFSVDGKTEESITKCLWMQVQQNKPMHNETRIKDSTTTWTINCVALNSYKQVMCANGHEFFRSICFLCCASLSSECSSSCQAINLGIQYCCRIDCCCLHVSIPIIPCNWRLCFKLSVIYIFRSASQRMHNTHAT